MEHLVGASGLRLTFEQQPLEELCEITNAVLRKLRRMTNKGAGCEDTNQRRS